MSTLNVLYFTLEDFDSIQKYHSINTDLLREFQKHGHNVFVVSPSERRKKNPTQIIKGKNAVILKPRVGNITKTNIVEKGISTVTIGYTLIRVIKQRLRGIKFDLILYCTPPITFLSAVEYVKKRDGARTYLLLKDIFPQNAVDIGLITKSGVKGILYWYFRNQEQRLYKVSDTIGCMSPANMEYLLKHNDEVKQRNDANKRGGGRGFVEVCPNCIEVADKSVTPIKREQIRKKYGIPLDKTVFVYGGNLGKPQGIDFILKCLHSQKKNQDVFFFIVGSGTEYGRIERYIEKYKPENIVLHKYLDKADYDTMIGACDVGLIFLDHRFTIPNFPSRLLSYMSAKLPVMAVTDPNTDIMEVVTGVDKNGTRTHEGFGWWCESDSVEGFASLLKEVQSADLKALGQNAWIYLQAHYTSEKAYRIINK